MFFPEGPIFRWLVSAINLGSIRRFCRFEPMGAGAHTPMERRRRPLQVRGDGGPFKLLELRKGASRSRRHEVA